MRIPRTLVASLISPLALLLPLLAVSLWEANQPVQLIDGAADDAPMRAFGVFVITLPIIYVLLALLSHAVGIVLMRLKFISLPRFVGASATLAALLSVPVGLVLGDPRQFGAPDALATLAVVLGVFVLSAVPGSLCWWYLAAKRGA